MDPTILGVFIGFFLTIAGQFVTQLYISKREEKRWEWQHEVEEKKQLREEQKADKNHLRDVYYNSIRALSLFISAYNRTATFDKELELQLYEDAHKWLTMLTLFHMDSPDADKNTLFSHTLESFRERPNANTADFLLNQVFELARSDKRLFPDAMPPTIEREDEFRIKIRIDKEFRRQQFREGIELPASHKFTIKIADLTPRQREMFWDVFIETQPGKTPPRGIYGLPLPTYNAQQNQVSPTGANWAAPLNPLNSTPRGIFDAWERDYEEAFGQAQQSVADESENA